MTETDMLASLEYILLRYKCHRNNTTAIRFSNPQAHFTMRSRHAESHISHSGRHWCNIFDVTCILAVLVLLLSSSAMASPPPRKVFAHYMVRPSSP